ncbi:MAG: hypothetical protein DWQ35_09295 [Planctomycetota bacterium]|nr:MAG: hypothetical protein DWQ35_09295 [Planctomycetota bacterium]
MDPSRGGPTLIARKLSSFIVGGLLLAAALGLPARSVWAIVAHDPLGVAGATDLGTPHTNVVSLFVPAGFCSGTLIDSTHILTAKHCTAGAAPSSMSVQFYLDNDGVADATYGVTAKAEAAGSFSLLDGTDIAVLTLDAPAPAGVMPARIGFGDAVGHTAELVGFGFSGIGSTGTTIGFDGQRKAVDNIVDFYGAPQGSGAGGANIFSTDFDSGSSNTLGFLGSSPTPLDHEGTTAGGDSGGPLLIDGKIYGVVSSGSTSNSPYGDISWWTGAGQHYSFIRDHAPGVQLGVIPTVSSDASFSDLSNVDVLNLDFGTVAVDDVVAPLPFSISNLPDQLTVASLDFLSDTGSGDTGILTTDLMRFVNLDRGATRSFEALLDTSTAGSFSASYDLSFSDYLGNDQTLTLNLSGIVQSLCAIGDADCDGDVDINGDILPAFSNFTGPGTAGTNKTRAQGDVHGDGTGATTDPAGHDSDVDVSDLLTMLSSFTGPLDEGGVGPGGGLMGPAEAGDPAIPDLIYDAATGEVVLDPDGSSIIGYSLQNATNSFLPGNHTPILVGVATALTSQLEEAALAPGSGSIGLVFPTGLDLAGLQALLTVNQVSRSLGAPLVPFDLVVLSSGPVVPEPSTYTMTALAILVLGLYGCGRRRADSPARARRLGR